MQYRGATIKFDTGGEFFYTNKANLDAAHQDLSRIDRILIPVGIIFWDGVISADDPDLLDRWHPPVKVHNTGSRGADIVLEVRCGGLQDFWIERKRSVDIQDSSDDRLEALVICMVKDGVQSNLVVKERSVYLAKDTRAVA